MATSEVNDLNFEDLRRKSDEFLRKLREVENFLHEKKFELVKIKVSGLKERATSIQRNISQLSNLYSDQLALYKEETVTSFLTHISEFAKDFNRALRCLISNH